MGSALLNPAAQVAARLHGSGAAPETPEELRLQVAARLAAHRERRLRNGTSASARGTAAGSTLDPQKSRIAAAVAERYGKAQSYRAFLAAEAERAIQHAQAAAEIAARTAQAVAETQQRLLDSLAVSAANISHSSANDFGVLTEQALWPELDEPIQTTTANRQSVSRGPTPAEGGLRVRAARAKEARSAEPSSFCENTPPIAPARVPAVRVVSYDNTPAVTFGPAPRVKPAGERPAAREQHLNDPEALALDEEISFRQAPVFEEPAGPPMPLPANLIEFPRQLVASRKARPRYAEGPLRDEELAAGSKEQLRIFEVDPAQISTTPDSAERASTTLHPQWTSIWLDTATAHAPGESPCLEVHVATRSAAARPQTAKLSRRALAGSIDLTIAAVAGLACAASFAATTALIEGQVPWHMETLRALGTELLHTVPLATIALSGVAALFLLSVLLQVVVFTFSDATPGMRIARIGLCTSSDENPTRIAMRRRIPALVLSTTLAGLGFAWSLLDEDRLTWHDLISRMYQRSY